MAIPGTIYVIKTRDHLLVNKPVYKIGRTTNLEHRMSQYPKGSFLLLTQNVADTEYVEQRLKEVLKNENTLCYQCHHLGIEWFETIPGVSESLLKERVIEILTPFSHSENGLDDNDDTWLVRYNETNNNPFGITLNSDLFDPSNTAERISALEDIIKTLKDPIRDIDSTDIAYMYYGYVKDHYKLSGEKDVFLCKNGFWTKETDANYLTQILKTIEKDIVFLMEHGTTQEIRTKADKIHDKIGSVPFTTAILFSLRSMLYDRDFKNNLDNKHHLLAFNNGVWDFNIGAFRNTISADMISRKIGYDYNEERDELAAQEVEMYLASVFPDPSQRESMVKLVARELYGDKQNVVHLHTGLGDTQENGKSEFFRILKACLGDYVERFCLRQMKDSLDPKKPMPEIEQWRGVRILHCDYVSGDKIRPGILKDFVRAEKNYYRCVNEKSMSSFTSMYKVHIMCNKTPHFYGPDGEIQRMLHKTEYTREFENEGDVGYVTRLKNNPRFKMEFVRKLLDNFDMNYSVSGTNITPEDRITNFLQTYIQPTPGEFLPMQDITKTYRQSPFFTPRQNVKKENVEDFLGVVSIPVKTINRRTFRNVFQGFTISSQTEQL